MVNYELIIIMSFPMQNVANGGVDVMIATLVTTIITKKFNLDNIYYGMLFPLTILAINNFKNGFNIDYSEYMNTLWQ